MLKGSVKFPARVVLDTGPFLLFLAGNQAFLQGNGKWFLKSFVALNMKFTKIHWNFLLFSPGIPMMLVHISFRINAIEFR